MTGNRIDRQFQTRLTAPPERVFPLLCPIKEYDWIPQWRCEMIYSKSGVAELGCVFKTDFGDAYGAEVWVTSHYEPHRKIAFVRTGLMRSTRYEIEVQPEGNGSIITWRQEFTSLNQAGSDLLESFSQANFEAVMAPLNKMLEYYLSHGTALDIDLSGALINQHQVGEDESVSR